MSVYSGFATRKQEQFYNKMISKLVKMLTAKILSQVPYHEIASNLTARDTHSSELNQKQARSSPSTNSDYTSQTKDIKSFIKFDEQKWAI